MNHGYKTSVSGRDLVHAAHCEICEERVKTVTIVKKAKTMNYPSRGSSTMIDNDDKCRLFSSIFRYNQSPSNKPSYSDIPRLVEDCRRPVKQLSMFLEAHLRIL